MATEDIKAFEFGSKVATKEKIAGKFTVNGDTFSVRAIKDAQIAYLIAQVSHEDPMKVVVSVLDFTERVLAKESAPRFEALVLGKDGGDGLELKEVMEVFQHILTLVAADPTGGAPSASSRARKTTTASSRATTR